MNLITSKIQAQYLFKIKQIIDMDKDGDRFVIVRRGKNNVFLREHNLTIEDVKNIIRKLTIDDYKSGPDNNRNEGYEGEVFVYNPIYEGIKLYLKISIENLEKTVCISIHEFRKIDEVN